MSTFTTSRNTRGQHVSPKYQSAPYRPSPGRREHIHGRIQPLESDRTITLSNIIIIGFFLVVMMLSAAKGWGW